MFGLSISHLLLLLIIILLLFGAKRLPELGSALGEGLRAFKKGLEGTPDERPQIDQRMGQQPPQQNRSPVSGVQTSNDDKPDRGGTQG